MLQKQYFIKYNTFKIIFKKKITYRLFKMGF